MNNPVCPNCGAPVSPTAKFCMTCGTNLATAAPENASYKSVGDTMCPNCGAPVSLSDKFCMQCGTPVNHDDQPLDAPVNRSEKEFGDDVAAEAPKNAFGKFMDKLPGARVKPERKGKGCAKTAIICSIVAVCMSGSGYLLFSKSSDTVANASSELSAGLGFMGYGGSAFLWGFGMLLGLLAMGFAIAAIVRSQRMVVKGIVSIVIATVACMLPSFYSAIML